MSIQLDNVKMWNMFYTYISKINKGILPTVLVNALAEQGLQFKDGHIVSIKEQDEIKGNNEEISPNSEEVEWYIALDDVGYYKNPVAGWLPLIAKGERTTKEKVFHLIPDMKEEEFNKFFRPATPEEIQQKPTSPAPQRDNYDEIKQAEPKQENSPTFFNSESNMINAIKSEIGNISEIQRNVIFHLLQTWGYLKQ